MSLERAVEELLVMLTATNMNQQELADNLALLQLKIELLDKRTLDAKTSIQLIEAILAQRGIRENNTPTNTTENE